MEDFNDLSDPEYSDPSGRNRSGDAIVAGSTFDQGLPGNDFGGTGDNPATGGPRARGTKPSGFSINLGSRVPDSPVMVVTAPGDFKVRRGYRYGLGPKGTGTSPESSGTEHGGLDTDEHAGQSASGADTPGETGDSDGAAQVASGGRNLRLHSTGGNGERESSRIIVRRTGKTLGVSSQRHGQLTELNINAAPSIPKREFSSASFEAAVKDFKFTADGSAILTLVIPYQNTDEAIELRHALQKMLIVNVQRKAPMR